jgi:hypothetical protein
MRYCAPPRINTGSNVSLRTPIEIALAQYMVGYHGSLVADTPAMEEYIAREVAKSIVWVPGRMIDDVEHMIAEWRKNENNVVFPGDELGRVYRVATVCNEYKAQIVFIGPEQASAHSLLLQFNAWTTQGPTGRRFYTEYEFSGFKSKWPAVMENIDYGGVSSPPGDQTNLTVLVTDMTIRATVPLFTAPKAGQPNDGKAAPAGYPVVVEVDSVETFAGAMGAQRGTHINTQIDALGDITQVRS